jgi:hypothetical protein
MTALLWLVGAAWPCAGLVHEGSLLAESDAASAIFERAEGGTAVTYEVTYAGNAADFGWIVPVPGDFVSIVEADPQRFADLDGISAPVVETVHDTPSGCGCSKGDALAGGEGRGLGDTSNGVDIVAEGFTGTYEYVAIAAADSADLIAWLETNGWAVGDTADAIDHYVALGDVFVALKVVPQVAETPDEGRLLPPVTLTYGGDVMRFPAVMAAYASAPEQRTVVYVVGEGTATATGWTAEEVPQIVGTIDDSGAALWEDALRARGAATKYALTYSDGQVTRFDTLAPRSAHTADATFTLGAARSVETRVVLYEDPPESSSAMGLLPLAAAGWLLRRRRGAGVPVRA